jgi:hypothetical protein
VGSVASVGRFGKGLELVEELLQPGEEVIASVFATLCDPPTGKIGKLGGALAITAERLVFAARFWPSRAQQVHQLNQVSSLNLSKSGLVSHLQVLLTGTFENYVVKYREAEHFLATAQGVLAKAHTQPPAPAAALSAADELAKLADLHRQGILSAEEFAKAKARLLG